MKLQLSLIHISGRSSEPIMICSEQELEDQLSQPSPHDVAALRALSGDLLILGVSGKMGPSLARRAARAVAEAGVKKRITGVARFSDPRAETLLREAGVETHRADLLDFEQLNSLPDAENVIFMAGRKFGSTGAESLTSVSYTHLDVYKRQGELYESLPADRVRCYACGHCCPISSGFAGVCKVRFNRDGVLQVPYGYVNALHCDPIEKKPFYHALAGTSALSFGMLGCDLHCGYCQNWVLSLIHI